MPIYVEGSEAAALPGVDAVYVEGAKVWPIATGPTLVAYYTFDDTPEDIAALIARDSSGNGRDIHAVPVACRRSPGHNGSAYAALNRVTVAGPSGATSGNLVDDFIDPMHVSGTCWFLYDGTIPNTEIGIIDYGTTVAGGPIFRVSQTNSGTVRMQMLVGTSRQNSSAVTLTNPGPDRWVHLAITYDGDEGWARLYVNGTEAVALQAKQGFTPITGPLQTPFQYLQLCADTGRGRIADSARFYLNTLTPEEVAADMASG